MKKYVAVFLSLVLCICFFSCGKADIPDTTVNASGEKVALEENIDAHSESETESVTESVNESRSEEHTKDAQTDSAVTVTKTEVPTSQSKKSDTKTTTSPQKPTEDSNKKPTESATEKQTEVSSKITCTVQVECKSILNKKNKFKKDVSLIPDDGVILTSVKVSLDDGATAYDALKKACDENGIELQGQKSSMGIYIVGIGGINEKDCGAQSGWIYTVNGQSPSVGLSNYKIKNGESLALSYVC